MSKKTNNDQEPVPLLRTPGFMKTYATRVLIQPTEYDFRVVITNEKVSIEEQDHFVAEGMVILTPLAAKELGTQLKKEVAAWEKEFGKIPKRPKTSKYMQHEIEE